MLLFRLLLLLLLLLLHNSSSALASTYSDSPAISAAPILTEDGNSSTHFFLSAQQAFKQRCAAIRADHMCVSWRNTVLADNETLATWLFDSRPIPAARQRELVASLRGHSITLLGDSMPWQMSQALRCMVNEHATEFRTGFAGMHTVPIRQTEVAGLLDRCCGQQNPPDVVVFAIGTWYNFESLPNETEWERVSAEETNEIVDKKCNANIARTLRQQSGVVDAYKFGLSRRQCLATLGAVAFASDLQRLAYAIGNFSQARRAQGKPTPRFVWREVVPQHCATSEDGQFNWNGRSKVGDIAPTGLAAAYKRNVIANRVLAAPEVAAAFDGGVIRAWNNDVGDSSWHIPGDCTHACNPSRKTWDWALQVLEHSIKLFPKRSEN